MEEPLSPAVPPIPPSNLPMAGSSVDGNSNSQVDCGRCRNPILASQVHAMEKVGVFPQIVFKKIIRHLSFPLQFYHPECFRCLQCDRVLRDSFRSWKGHPYCQECYRVSCQSFL